MGIVLASLLPHRRKRMCNLVETCQGNRAGAKVRCRHLNISPCLLDPLDPALEGLVQPLLSPMSGGGRVRPTACSTRRIQQTVTLALPPSTTSL
ncbi:hypothetical protein Y1Q_0021737 [Alligator mississippiensis]|uniref:Uncharacterized protein n=1 Tax=Alligator mississippiensis TaxID=8496 RepID=A0A151PB99_ALLMI|nr:hypothetical protein Y1Q_0021737 [Alligator mississippiensis]